MKIYKKKNKILVGLMFVICFIIQFNNIQFKGTKNDFKDDTLNTLSSSNLIIYNWNITWGSVDDDYAYAIALDSLDNIYLAGYTTNTTGGDKDICLVKFNSGGNFQWNRTWGRNYEDRAHAIVIDSSDNIYVAGYTSDSYDRTNMTLVKYDSSGVELWNLSWGENDNNEAYGIALDSLENIYLAGMTWNMTTEEDMCLVKFNTDGNYQWNRTWGGNYDDYVYAIALDSLDNIYLAGEYTAIDDIDQDSALVKFNSNGDYQWNRTWGGDYFDAAQAITLDSSENIYIAGYSESFAIGIYDMCIVKYNNAGDYQWNRTWGGIGLDSTFGMASDASDNIYIVGTINNTMSSNLDFYVGEFDTSGVQQWNHTWDSSEMDVYLAIAFDSLENLYIAGTKNFYWVNPDMCLVKYENIIPEINIITPENKTYIEPMSGYYPATYGFENDEDEQDPKEWVIQEKNDIIEVISELDNHKKVLRLHDSSMTHPSRLYNNFDSKNNGTIELWIRQNHLDYNEQRGQISGYGNGNQIFLVKMVGGSPAKWQARDNGTDITISGAPTPLIDTWYHIRIDFEHTMGEYQGLNQNEYYVYIDGIRYGPYLSTSDEPLDELHLHTYSYGYIYNTYFDAVGYSWDQNYNIGDNLNEGLLISYETNLDLNWRAFSLDNQANITILGNYTIPFLEDGIHNIQIFGNDSFSNQYKSDLIHFTIDTSPPEILINSPTDNEYFGVSAPAFNITINELNINTTWYTLDSGNINITFNGLSGIINQTEWGKKDSELVTIRFYANDSFGLENYAEVTIHKDIDSPSSILSFVPHSDKNIVNRSSQFTITANDGLGSGVSIIRYKINNSAWVTYTGAFDLSDYVYGDYLITYQAIDAVGNIESEHTRLVSLIQIPSKKSEIPGFSTILIFSLIGLVSLILIKRYKK